MPRRSRRRLVPMTALIACAMPCAGASAAPLPEARAASAAKLATMRGLVDRRAPAAPRVPRVVRAVKTQLGDGYAYGGSGPDGFDCSGLTRFAFARTGVELPHDSHAQATMGRRVARARIRPGDLVFFSTAGPGASHVGIAVSRSKVVSATSSGGVMQHAIDDAYWGAHYVKARRVD